MNSFIKEKQHLPASVFIASDYYDGPVGGVLQIGQDARTYKFEMVDWDKQQNIRIFSISSIGPELFKKFIEIISDIPKGVLPPTYDRDSVYTELINILSKAGDPEIIMAWRSSDEMVLCVKEVSPKKFPAIVPFMSEINSSNQFDWFSFLNVDANSV